MRNKSNTFSLCQAQDKLISALTKSIHKEYGFRSIRAFQRELQRQGYSYQQCVILAQDAIDIYHLNMNSLYDQKHSDMWGKK